VRITADLPLVVAEGVGGRDLEARRLGSNRVLERTALHAGEDGAVDADAELFAAEDEAGARPGESLVRRRRDVVAVLDRVRVQARRDEPGEMRHVAEQQRT